MHFRVKNNQILEKINPYFGAVLGGFYPLTDSYIDLPPWPTAAAASLIFSFRISYILECGVSISSSAFAQSEDALTISGFALSVN